MKAVVWTKYGSPDGLQLKELEKPTPKDNQVLIKIYASSVTAGDCELRSLKFPIELSLPIRLYMGFVRPRNNKVLGQELAGEIEAIGKDVTRFKKGDQIFAASGFNFGAHAEYKCMSENETLALKPTNMTYEEAAAVPLSGLEALHFIKRAELQPGQKMLVYGAGGSIGTFAVQLAKHFGVEVTGVDKAEKLDMLRAIGTDHVIDYAQQDFTQNGQTYDAILDVVGKTSFSRSIKSLNPNGRYLLVNPSMGARLRSLWLSKESNKQVITGSSAQSVEDLLFLKSLIEDGKLKTIIDRRYPLEQAAEAHRYVETGRKKGNVIITIAASP